jgi:hypothetical protein
MFAAIEAAATGQPQTPRLPAPQDT